MALPGDVPTALAALFLLVGVPAILFGLLFLYTGRVRRDAERSLEDLEAAADADGTSDDAASEDAPPAVRSDPGTDAAGERDADEADRP